MASEAPNAILTPPNVTEEFDNLAFAILPANCALVIVPTKEEVGYPVASVKLNAGVASVPPRAIVIPPREIVEPTNFDTSIDPASCALVIVPTSSVVL